MAQSDENMNTIPTKHRDCPSAVPRPTSVPVVAQTKLPWVLVAILLAIAAASLGLYWSSVVRGPVGISKFEDYLMEQWRVPAIYADALDFTNMRPSTYLILALPSAGLGLGLILRWGRRGRTRDCPPGSRQLGKTNMWNTWAVSSERARWLLLLSLLCGLVSCSTQVPVERQASAGHVSASGVAGGSEASGDSTAMNPERIEQSSAAEYGQRKRADLEETKAAAERGDPSSAYRLGMLYLRGEGVRKDPKEAMKWFRRAAEKGEADAQRQLGYMYWEGRYLQKDTGEALKWLRKAAGQGHANAQNDIGCIYNSGDGVRRDPAEAARWFKQAADQGNAGAQGNLGLLYAAGAGVSRDMEAAAVWLHKSADGGAPLGEYNFGILCRDGVGTPRDLQKALALFQSAAHKGLPEAQYELGRWYAMGRYIKQDVVQGFMWATLATSGGHPNGAQLVSALQKSMTDDQVKRACELAGSFVPTGGTEMEVGTVPQQPVVAEEELVESVVEAGGPVAGQNWTVPDLKMEMAYVEPGSFLMGSDSGDSEKPVHTVRVSRAFWMGKCEVTQAQYQAVMGTNPNFFKGSDLPVENVSWDDAVAFCRKLTERERRDGRLAEGYVYRLPTEAEWEYAARGGAKSRGLAYVGSNTLDEVAWNGSNSDSKTHPVGQKKPNELGLYDLLGNVWEWCHDGYGAYRPSPASDPTGRLASSGPRVHRGGSWGDDPGNCRATFRFGSSPVTRARGLGFRVVVSWPLD